MESLGTPYISWMLYDILWLLIDQTLSHMSDDNDPFSYFRIDNNLFINIPRHFRLNDICSSLPQCLP